MNNRKKPYFMTNAKWYRFDEEKDMFVLTEVGQGIERVVKTYEEYYQHDDKKKHVKKPFSFK